MEVVYWILKYLKGNPIRGIFFGKSKEGGIEAFTNVDWFKFVNDRRSTFDYCMLV